jgi:heat-inducible transcriptional repressor
MSIKNTKKFLLDSIIKAYIENLEPIGSNSLKNMYQLRHSPATIRGYFRQLGDDGFLEQEHISSGRTPTTQALKEYWQKTLCFKKKKIDYDKLEQISKQIDCAIFLKQQKKDKLIRVLDVDGLYIVLDFNSFAITIKYNKALFRFLDESIGMELNYILDISKQINAHLLTVELNKHISNSIFEIINIKSFLKICSCSDISDKYMNKFFKGDIMSELDEGIYFDDYLPSGYMAISNNCVSQYCDVKIIVVGDMMRDYEYLYKEILI